MVDDPDVGADGQGGAGRPRAGRLRRHRRAADRRAPARRRPPRARAARARRRGHLDAAAALVPRPSRLPHGGVGPGHQHRARVGGCRPASTTCWRRWSPSTASGSASSGGASAGSTPARWPPGAPQRVRGVVTLGSPLQRGPRRPARRPDDVGVQPHRRDRAVAGVAAGRPVRGGRTSRSAAATSASATTRPCSSSSPTGWPSPRRRGSRSSPRAGRRRWIPEPVTT